MVQSAVDQSDVEAPDSTGPSVGASLVPRAGAQPGYVSVTASAEGHVRRRLSRSIRLETMVRTAPLVVVTVLVIDYVIAVLRPATRGQIWLWTTATAGFPIWFVGALSFTAVGCTILAGARSALRSRLVDVLVVLEMTSYFFGTKIWPPTGDQMGWWQNSATRNLALSEPLADLAHKIPYWMTGSLASVRYVSPIFGAMTIAVYLVLAHRLARVFGAPLWAFRAFVIASPLPFWYVTGYIENTFLALPFMLLGIERTLAYFDSRRQRTLCGAATSFALAGLFHAGFALMCFAFAGALLLRTTIPLRRRVVDLICSAGIVLAVVALVLGLVQLLPVDLVQGNTSGGYDDDLFTPMAPRAGDPMFRFVFFSHAHVIEVANIVVHASPGLVLALPLVAALGLRRRRLAPVLVSGTFPASAGLTVLACTALVYVLFVSVWGFDYGPVGDLDLMLVMGSGLGLYVLALSGSLLRGRPAILAALLTASSVANVAFYSMKVANAWV